MNKIILIITLLASILLSACNSKKDQKVIGYKPIYAQTVDFEIKNLPTIPQITNAGKIYIRNNFFYQLDNGKGVLIIDISDKSAPTPHAYIQVVGAQEISIKNNNLFVNSLNDLVIIDIENIEQVKEIGRVVDAFNLVDQKKSPPERGSFECVDTNKGTVIGWQKTELNNPKCRI